MSIGLLYVPFGEVSVQVLSSHTCQNGYHQKVNKQHMLVRMWRKGNTFALLVGLQIGVLTVETLWRY